MNILCYLTISLLPSFDSPPPSWVADSSIWFAFTPTSPLHSFIPSFLNFYDFAFPFHVLSSLSAVIPTAAVSFLASSSA